MGIFKNASRAMNAKMIEVQSGMIAENAKNQSKIGRMKSMALTAVCLGAMFTTMASANQFATVGQKISDGMQDVFNVIRGIARPVGIVSLVACGVAYFFGGEKGMEAGKKWAFRVAIGLAIVGLAPTLITAVYNVFKTDDDGIFTQTFS